MDSDGSIRDERGRTSVPVDDAADTDAARRLMLLQMKAAMVSDVASIPAALSSIHHCPHSSIIGRPASSQSRATERIHVLPVAG